MGTDSLYYIMDYSGNYYRTDKADQLVAVAGEQDATVFTFAQANSRICVGKKASFYCMVPIEETEEDMNGTVSGSDEIDDNSGALPVEEQENNDDEYISPIKELTYDEVTEPIEKNVASYDLSEMDWIELDIFKSKGKELQCIIPISGPFERFTLSEDTIRFLVLSLIQPGDKMTLKMFLEKLYQNYRIVIGPEEYRKSMQDSSMDSSLANSFSENVVAFQQFLRSTGFLKELSDATSIVINPYEPIEEVIS